MNKVYIIAEIGVNCSATVWKANKFIKAAKLIGADAVKFQHWGSYYADRCKWPEKIEGQRFSNEGLAATKEYADSLSIEWFCTAFDEESFDFVDSLGVNIYKIAANNPVLIENKILVDKIFSYAKRKPDKKLFYSVDITNYMFHKQPREWHRLLAEFENNKNFILFHCIPEYPLKLSRMILEGLKFSDIQGYSDHSSLIEIPIAAVVAGARYIEAHITWDKNDEGPDHKSSLTVEEFSRMVKMIRNVEKIL